MAVDRHTAASQPQRSELAPLVRGWGQRALLTQQQLAERAGLGLRTITRLESGNSGRLRPGSVLLLSKALGLSESERSQLLAAAGGHPAQPVPAPAAPVPAQLPAEVAGFTGRSTYVAELDAPLAGGRTDGRAATAVAISAIAGTAGIGKTALAVRWAHQIASRFPDGQLFVDLHGYAPAAPLTSVQALALLLRCLGIPAAQIPAEEAVAAGLYRSLLAGKQVLNVVDNARDADQVRPLLPGSPGCLVVVTSRDVCAIHTPLARHSTGRRSRTAMRPPTMTPQRVPLHAT